MGADKPQLLPQREGAEWGEGCPARILEVPGAALPDSTSGELERPQSAPMQCNQFWHRIIKGQRNALKPVLNASRADCGPRGKHWKWYRDRSIKRRKKRRCI